MAIIFILDKYIFVVNEKQKWHLNHNSGTCVFPLYKKFCSAYWPHAATFLIYFFETELDIILKSEGIKNLIICGMQSELCVDSTSKDAFAHGYKVILVADGHSTYDRKNISAEQIIELENSVLGDWFAELKSSSGLVKSINNKEFD